jgi:hypothetical protein
VVVHTSNPNYLEGRERGIVVQGWPGKTKSKRIRGMAQEVEHSPSKYEALSSIPVLPKTNKQKTQTKKLIAHSVPGEGLFHGS